MKTKIFYSFSYCPDSVFYMLKIFKRMGWEYKDSEDDGYILVNIPIEDEPLFDFLDIG